MSTPSVNELSSSIEAGTQGIKLPVRQAFAGQQLGISAHRNGGGDREDRGEINPAQDASPAGDTPILFQFSS
jgi:hypothetical protein